MPMKSFYIKENEKYAMEELRELLCFTKEHYSNQQDADKDFVRFVKNLKSRGILKSHRKKKELLDSYEFDEEPIFDDYTDANLVKNTGCYSFQFVGIIIIQSRILYCYPKYLNNDTADLEEQMYQVVKVLEKYSRQFNKQDIRDVELFSDIDENGKINLLSVILFILEDYAKNGLYRQEESTIDINGNGEVLWQKTVDTVDPVIQDGIPYYTELYTKRRTNNELDFCRRLHAYVVTKCSEEVEETKLASFYGLPLAEISDEEESSFGDIDYITERLENELKVVFDDRKVMVIKAMIAYFKSNRISTGEDGIRLIGTKAFNLIWENVCAKVYDTQKSQQVDMIKPNINYDIREFNVVPTLVELIKKPVWKRYSDNVEIKANRTFNPDYLRFEQKNIEEADEYTFYIIDAKYYCPQWTENSIEGQPGVEDIAKQYMYYLAYADLLKEHPEITAVENYFVMPKVDRGTNNDGYARLEILEKLQVLENHNLGKIKVRCLSPSELFDDFLKDNTRNLIELSENYENM